MKKTNYNILIAGYGNIGKLEYEVYSKRFPDTAIYDKYFLLNKDNYSLARSKCKSVFSEAKALPHYDFCIVCVDTPLGEDGLNSISAVEDVINSVNADIFILRSTVPVGTTRALSKKYNKHIVMSPEFYGTTQHANSCEFNFSIFGGELEDCYKCQQMQQEIFSAYHSFELVLPESAELAKFYENVFLALKVTLGTMFWEICNMFFKDLGVKYEEIQKCIKHDPRIGASHTDVYDLHPFWDSHCLNKDTKSYETQFAPLTKLISAMREFNEYMKGKYGNTDEQN